MRSIRYTFFIVLSLLIIYLVGPQNSLPVLNTKLLPISAPELDKLDEKIYRSEFTHRIKSDNQARIVWADSTNKKKTKYSIVYLHGFGASQAEGDPVHLNVAKHFGCNLYLSRLEGHGIDTSDVFGSLTAQKLLNTAKEAVNIGRQIGEKVIVIATSAGCASALTLAADNPEIEALVLYSPLIGFYNKVLTNLVAGPWGMMIARAVTGGNYHKTTSKEERLKYWNEKYRFEAVVQLKLLVSAMMQASTFKKIKQPVFLAYYYKDEKYQDMTVSVPDMLKMYDDLGTSPEKKQKQAFPAGAHVLASKHTTKYYDQVEKATIAFFEKVIIK